MWRPVEIDELRKEMTEAMAEMAPVLLRLWELVRVEPVKWRLPPWGDDGGGFWVVGLIGSRAIWYNDLEMGFNISPYVTVGTIEAYFCNQDEPQWTLHSLCAYLLKDGRWGAFGPPEPPPESGESRRWPDTAATVRKDGDPRRRIQ